MERLRRWILLGGFALAALLFMYVSLSPLVMVTLVDFAAEQGKEGRSAFLDMPSEHEQYLRQLPLTLYIAEKTKDRLVVAADGDWERFFDQALASATGAPPADWKAHISPDSFSDRIFLFFRPHQEPLLSIRDRWQTHGQELYLLLERGEKKEYLRLRYQTYSFDDVQLGSGFMRHPEPPPHFLHPFRTVSPWVFGLSLLLYFLLPGPKREPGDLFYARWRCMLGDLVSLMLFGLFFTLPLLVSGGSLQAFVPPGIILVIVLWPLAGMGALMSDYQGWYAAYTLRIQEDRLVITTLTGKGEYRFTDMVSFGAVSLRPPRWLVVTLSIAALFQKGGARYTTMGQSLILSGSEYGGLAIRLKDGATVYLWITDQMGGQALKSANRIVAAMKAAGVAEEEAHRVIHALIPPTFQTAGQKPSSRGAVFLMTLVLLPLVGIGVLVGLTELPRNWRSIQALIGTDEAYPDPKRAIPDWTHPSLEWYSHLGLETGGHSTRAGAVCVTQDGGALVAAQNMTGRDVGFFVIRTDGSGTPLWQTACGTEQWDYAETILEAQDGGCLVVGAARPEVGFSGATRAYLVRLRPSGEKEWDSLLGTGDGNVWGEIAVQRPDGGWVAVGLSGKRAFLFQLDDTGRRISERHLPAVIQESDEPKTVLLDSTSHLLIAGITLSPGVGFKDLYLLKLDPGGTILWRATAGGNHLDRPSMIRETADGGYLVVGLTRSFGSGGEDVYLVKVNGAGRILWEKSFGTAGDEQGVDGVETRDGAYMVLGQMGGTDESLPQILLVQTDAGGHLIREERFSWEGHSLLAGSLVESPDGALIMAGSYNRSGYLADHAFLAKFRLPH